MKPKADPKTMEPLAPESEDDVKHVAEAERARETTWAEDKERAWNGQPLLPWSRGRESLLARLVAADVPGGDLEDVPLIEGRLERRKEETPESEAVQALTIEGVINVLEYLPMAAKLLYLARHEPQQWDHLRGQHVAAFLRAIETWAETAIEPGQEWLAVRTAVEIKTAHRKMMAMRRPTPGARRHEGN